ncbi:MAG: acyltransferase [Prosthecobacter sp.]|uniref:acyltransferase n=1 Tax=Prosthecobacter sp. TaxID=1965333 RepID=UPI0025CF45C6|nr:acyltransferase [Prosthecobacter sp.]MCF7784615.1 acyltransferase [Prosthecobacter sp.]
MKRFLNKIRNLLFTSYCQFHKVITLGRSYVSGSWPVICNQGSFHLGRGVCFRSFRTKTRIDVFKGASLNIGDGCYINDGVNICCSTSITIGTNTKIADWVVLYDTDFHPIEPTSPVHSESITLGKNVWIGARAMILPGSVIGDHSVIAAGAIVRGHIPAWSIAAGIPAKVIKTFTCDDDWVRP